MPAAIAYAALACLPIAMHIAIAFGAPLGRFTVGGRFEGRLPPLWRGLAVVQACILGAMAWVILNEGSPASWLTVVTVITALSLIANTASPSKPERLLWTPVLFLMTVAALVVTVIR